MKTIELNGKIVGVVEVPSDFTNIAGITTDHLYCWTTSLTNGMGDYPYAIPIIKGNWQILSLASEMTEEQSALLGMTLQEFKEWLKSLGYVVQNPYPYPANAEAQELIYSQWQEAQKLVQNLLIIVKEK